MSEFSTPPDNDDDDGKGSLGWACETLKAEMLAYLSETDWVSFAELQNRLGERSRGDFTIELPGNVILWAGVSEEFSLAFKELWTENLVFPWSSSALVYFIDGGALRLPIAQRPPKKGYKEPHWMPVTLRTVKQK